ncbi:MAG: IclR family transcriptional regulator [Rhodobacter sp.]|nr:IclR family transcriptional regulator [Paracoccaceae bacterium]MCC0076278.1 IclR family transcriptional regulator [Rhodobacter sp.]
MTTPPKKSAPPKHEARGVQSIELGARLLKALVDEGEPTMLKDLARIAGFAPAQAHAYLVSYRKIGLVDQDPATGRYLLGRFAMDLGITRMQTSHPMRLASDAAIALSEETGLIVALVVWGSFGPTVVQVQESGSQINMNTRPGTVYSMSGTASGRLFSAYLPVMVVKEAIRAEKRENGQTGRIGIHRFMAKAELEKIRHDGYATIENPPVPGVSAIAAPVFDHVGQLALAITIIGEDRILAEKAEQVFIPALMEAAEHLSNDLGCSNFRQKAQAGL